MKKVLYYLLGLVIVTSSVLSSCKKKHDPQPTKSKTELLTSGAWKWKNFQSTVPSEQGTDFYAQKQSTEKDNLYFFRSDKTVVVDEGPTKNGSAIPQISTIGNWSFSSDESKILITSAGSTGSITIVSLTETEFVFIDNGFKSTWSH